MTYPEEDDGTGAHTTIDTDTRCPVCGCENVAYRESRTDSRYCGCEDAPLKEDLVTRLHTENVFLNIYCDMLKDTENDYDLKTLSEMFDRFILKKVCSK